jgi:hypothetical protein
VTDLFVTGLVVLVVLYAIIGAVHAVAMLAVLALSACAGVTPPSWRWIPIVAVGALLWPLARFPWRHLGDPP